jgi:hypothetical protein
MTTYHVFGDTGGHYKQLRDGLIAIGMDRETWKLPEDVIIVHLGDLIHKGPDSQNVLELVDFIMETNPGQWIQLLGNHEFQYLKGAPFFWRETISVQGQQLLQSWLEKRLVRTAYAIEGPVQIHDLAAHASQEITVPNKPILFTHSGLTRAFWQIRLNRETDVINIVNMINQMPVKLVTTAGEMLGGVSHHGIVGPVWALGTREVWSPWNKMESMPFIQIHGHTTPFNYYTKTWWPAGEGFVENSVVNLKRNTVTTKVADSLQIAVDPGYSKGAPNKPQPSLKITIP